MKQRWKKTVVIFLAALLAFAWQFYGTKYDTGLMTVELALEDAVYRRPTGSTQNIKIIGIDEETLQAYGKLEEWSREKLAELIELLSENPETAPAVIGLDFLLTGETTGADSADERLAQACTKAGNVVVASKLVCRTEFGISEEGSYYYDEWKVELLERPYDALAAVTGQGFVNALQDKDGYIRRAKLTAEYQGTQIESFPYKIANLYNEYRGEAAVKANSSILQFLYSGKPGEYEKVSLVEVLNGNVDLRTFKNSIVLVGAYAPGMQDSYHVAVKRGEQMYGVEIHANILESLLAGKTVKNVSGMPAAILIMLVFAGYALLGQRQKLFPLLTEGLAIMALWLCAGLCLKQRGWLLPLSVVELGMPLLMIYFIVIKYVRERIGRKRVLKAFERYVAPQVVKELSHRNSFEIKLGGERREIAVLFVDLRGFTAMSERLEPEQVVEILNEYLNLTSQAIFKNQGTLDKFIGDATMAVFNAPVALEDYIDKAVSAAIDMVQGAKALEKQLEEKYGNRVQFGIGINCGPAIVGNIGSERRMDYTAIGDTVNTAARLESSAASGEILISQTVYEQVKDSIEAEPVGELELKGKQQKISAYRVLGRREEKNGEA